LKIQGQLNNSINSLLILENLTPLEQQKLEEIRNNFYNYYSEGKISEGQIKFLFLSPIMWLSGFYNSSIKVTLEEGIADIDIQDEETIIKGRMDILAATKVRDKITTTPLWILLIESKNSSIDASEGLPQLLTYAYSSLEHQQSVWGLTTNGMDYQFVHLQQGNPLTYQLFPKLSLIYPEPSIQLLQVMKAICNLTL
jgi:hypothetical protein